MWHMKWPRWKLEITRTLGAGEVVKETIDGCANPRLSQVVRGPCEQINRACCLSSVGGCADPRRVSEPDL